ncbi:MAG: VOC family protein [Melioribacteraceae bacterium]
MKIKFFISIILLIILLTNCDNKRVVEQSKNTSKSEVEKLESIKVSHNVEIKSILDSINNLKNQIHVNINLAEADIFSNLKNSFFDHIIIGSNNINESVIFFKKLGFSIKEGKVHKNGIRNNFIEFNDNTEIEIIEVNNPTENFTKEYEKIISQNKFGLQFALRVDEIETLKNNFTVINSNFVELQKGNDYSTLSAKGINSELPIFFIQFDKLNNSKTNHINNAKGISSVWFETKDIKKTARELVDIGFEPIGNYYIPTFAGKVVEFKNVNFKIVLIESDKYEITGITISVDSKSDLLKIINENFDKTFLHKIFEKEKSIFLAKVITKSIWLEFVEK